MIEVVRAGIATTLQDSGRPGLANIGVGAAGAVDPGLAALVNRLVGNLASAVVIETCGDLELVADQPAVIATTSELAPITLAPGQTVTIRPGQHGRLWQYVAVRGGIAAPPVLGSASTDTLSGLGPLPLVSGQRLGLNQIDGDYTVVDQAPLPELSSDVRVFRGPRHDWFTERSWAELTSTPWTVTTTSRIGVRLTGGAAERTVTRELPSEGLVRGAIQVPPDGDPVMMLADHPTTGGYPVIGVVHPDDVAVVGQHASGTSVRFHTTA